LPYSVFSLALLRDPFDGPEGVANSAEAEALLSARERAEDDLTKLDQAGGPNYDGHQAPAAAPARATPPPAHVKLARAWETEAGQLGSDRDQLGGLAGGLAGGLPKDVVDGVNRLQSVISAATTAQLSADPAQQALAHAQTYLKLQYPAML